MKEKNHIESILGFLKDFRILFGNNLSEQSKVQQKISGCFWSDLGAEVFAKIKSYIETIRTRGIDIIDAIGIAITCRALIPFA